MVERDYPNVYKRFTALGPADATRLGNGTQGHVPGLPGTRVELLKQLNGVVTEEGATKGLARIDTDIDAAEAMLMLAPGNQRRSRRAWACARRR